MSGPVILGARVLFVDDEEAIRRLFETFLSTEGFDVRGAASLAESQDLVKTKWPEVVIVDKKSVVEYSRNGAAADIRRLWTKVTMTLGLDPGEVTARR